MTDLRETALSLRQPTTEEDFTRLRRRLANHVVMLEEQQFEHDEVDLALARSIEHVLACVLDDVRALGGAQRSWLRAAIEYFLLTSDAEDDISSPSGLLDDAHVVNLVMVEIGRPDLIVDVAAR